MQRKLSRRRKETLVRPLFFPLPLTANILQLKVPQRRINQSTPSHPDGKTKLCPS